MKYLTDFAGVSHEGEAFEAVGGVVEIPDEHAGRFADMIAAGVLVPIVDDAKPTKPKGGRKAKTKPGDTGAPADDTKPDDDDDAGDEDTDTQ